MTNTYVGGAQWGDEGKGKIIDGLMDSMHAAIRFGGANNAGHTLEIGDKKYVTHTLPSGIIREGKINICGPYEAINLEVAIEEIKIAKEYGAIAMLDESAPVILPHHWQLDGAREDKSGKNQIGTTRKGVGPIFESLTSRRYVTLGDLRNEKRFKKALQESNYTEVKFLLQNLYGIITHTENELWDYVSQFNPEIIPLLCDARMKITKLIKNEQCLIFEGGQGIMLDLIHGAKPDVTSSFCSVGGAMASLGVYDFKHVIGVAKAYVTRVGNGAFPTELNCKIGETLRDKGHEYGATTGRPRRCGWLDLVALKYGCRMAGINELAITKIDILDDFKEIKVAVDYELDGKIIDRDTSLTAEVLHSVKPVYKTFPGWMCDTSKCRTWNELPKNAKKYLQFIEEYTERKIVVIGVGPEREQLINLLK